ncbi:ABC transporter substrate-binding protein [Anoxynatronum buryatiense]|uniref:Multiple sugar transport system substrate-binding protein n=1 Tax=Anoxynatronum buryatiense TaxID=489973 RepID=A0AA45WZA6_9CLOT|nr:ABC transporter substrate-binding protein [Anoxynatronum buryatiense]SMP71188.1 multiple sugar transport system substrate-binding protein [Anoxynatronum buryatiense]
MFFKDINPINPINHVNHVNPINPINRMKSFRLAALVLAVALFLSACTSGTVQNQASDTAATGSDTGTSAPAASAAPVSTEPITLTFLHVFSGPREEAMNEIVQGFNDSQDRIRVEHEMVPGWYGGLLEQLQTLAVARQLPDLTIMGLSSHNFMKEGLGAVSVQPYIEQENTDLSDFFPNMLTLGQDEQGEQIAMPFAISTPLIYVNKDLLEQAGIDYVDQPESWEQVREWAKKAAQPSAGLAGIGFQLDYDTWQFQTLVESFGGQMASQETQTIHFNDEPGQRVMDFWLTMMHEEGTYPNISGSEAAENFINGSSVMIVATTGNLVNFTANADFDLGIMLLPTYDNMVNRNPRRVPAGGSNLYIMPSDPEREAAAWEFVKYATSPEAGAIIVEKMGYMAARKSLIEPNGLLSAYMAANPQATRSYDQLEDLGNWYNWPGVHGARIDSLMLDAFAAAFLKEKTGEEALNGAAEEVRQILGW